jgi:uncharacterized RDD family membrane protein YckC
MIPLQSRKEERVLVPANLFKRLLNYVVDVLFFSILTSILLLLFHPDISGWTNNPDGISLKDQLMISFLYGLYMSATEAIFKGKTLGKMVTQTRAINLDGSIINAQTAFLRGLCRLVPFEQLSALGIPSRPWHDKWSHTIVADDKASGLSKNPGDN